MKLRDAIVASLVLLAPAAAQASPEPTCLPRAVMIETLRKQGAEPVIVAVTRERVLYEILAAPDGRWVALYTLARVSCLALTGDGFEIARPAAEQGPRS